MQLHTPHKLIPITRSQFSRMLSAIGAIWAMTPALLNAASSSAELRDGAVDHRGHLGVVAPRARPAGAAPRRGKKAQPEIHEAFRWQRCPPLGSFPIDSLATSIHSPMTWSNRGVKFTPPEEALSPARVCHWPKYPLRVKAAVGVGLPMQLLDSLEPARSVLNRVGARHSHPT